MYLDLRNVYGLRNVLELKNELRLKESISSFSFFYIQPLVYRLTFTLEVICWLLIILPVENSGCYICNVNT